MGLCWSEPPAQAKPVSYEKPLAYEKPVQPSAPPMTYVHPQYQYNHNPYAVQNPQQQMYMYHQAPYYPQQPPPQQQQQIGTGTAIVGGFLLGAIVEDILDPMD